MSKGIPKQITIKKPEAFKKSFGFFVEKCLAYKIRNNPTM
jgi:hypothetical protein